MVPTKKYEKQNMKEQTTVSRPKETENNYSFQWLIFKPQSHAITPFQINEASRDNNKERK